MFAHGNAAIYVTHERHFSDKVTIENAVRTQGKRSASSNLVWFPSHDILATICVWKRRIVA